MKNSGLPGLNGFVGEFLILVGTFKVNKLFAILAASGVIFAAVYMLWMFQRVNFGQLDKPENKELKDLNKRELTCLVPIVVFCFWIGIYPSTFLGKTEATVNKILEDAQVKKEKVISESKQFRRDMKNLIILKEELTKELSDSKKDDEKRKKELELKKDKEKAEEIKKMLKVISKK